MQTQQISHTMMSNVPAQQPSKPKVEAKAKPKVIKLESNNEVGVVVTTYGKNNIFAIQNIRCFRTYLPTAKIFLYLNEVVHKTDIIEVCKQLHVEPIIVPDQTAYGGLTGTWNDGILKCISHRCDVIILSNDDLFVNETIHHIIHETRLANSKKAMEYFGPVTNNPGPSNGKQLFHLKNRNNTTRIINNRGLNGFFMAFPRHVLNELKFDATHFFDPAFPFGGNED
jgi:hypothetical protein